MRVLVLDGNQNQAVASVRSLAKAGHTVWVGESSSWSKAGWSRFCSRRFEYIAPRQDANAFVEGIADVVQDGPRTLVLPMTEATTVPISARRDRLLASGALLVLPESADLLRALDKDQATRLAASLGVTVPKTILVDSGDQARTVARSISYPVVLKPQASVEILCGAQIRIAGRPRYARNLSEFEDAFRDLALRCSRILVQEFVRGEGAGYFALMKHGRLRAEFAHRRIRDVHPTGSGSAVRISVEPDPEIRQASLSILQALRWHGVAMVEFRKPPGKPPVFLEVNGRFWNSLPLACHAGADFPALVAQMAEHGDVHKRNGYQTGVRCRWLLGDARHLVEVWKGPPAGYPGEYPGRFRTLLSMFTPVPGTYHDLFQWRDPLPELGDWISLGQRAVKKA